MSGGGGGAPFNSSGGPIDNQQRLQTSPNPSLPPADYSMGYARNFQTPSFFNPFSGYSGANTGMGGFQSQFGGFQQPQFGGFGGFGGFQQPQYGGFQQPQYGGFQQPQYGGFQQQQFGGFGGGFQQPQQFQQPFDGGYGGGFQQPFSGGFGRQSNRFTRRGQEYTQPYNPPQPNQPDYGNMNQFNQPQPMSQPRPPIIEMAPPQDIQANIGPKMSAATQDWLKSQPGYAAQQEANARSNEEATRRTQQYDASPKTQRGTDNQDWENFYANNPPLAGGMGNFQPQPMPEPEPRMILTTAAPQPRAYPSLSPPGLRQFTQPQNPFPPETQKAYAEDRAKRGPTEEMRITDSPEYWERMAKKEQPNWTKSSSPSLMGNGMGGYGGFNPMMGGLGGFGGFFGY